MNDPRLFGAVKLLEALDATGDAICALYDMDCKNCPMDLPHFGSCLSAVISDIHMDKDFELKSQNDETPDNH